MKTLIYHRKERSTSVLEEPDLILTPLKLSSRKKEEDNSCQEKQSEVTLMNVKSKHEKIYINQL